MVVGAVVRQVQFLFYLLHCAALIKSAAFSAAPYSDELRCALSCVGKIDASTTRTLRVSYTFRCAFTTPGTNNHQAAK